MPFNPKKTFVRFSFYTVDNGKQKSKPIFTPRFTRVTPAITFLINQKKKKPVDVFKMSLPDDL